MLVLAGKRLAIASQAAETGFKKVDPDRWEFANEAFLRGQRHLLKNIHRRKSTTQQQHVAQPSNATPSLEVGNLDGLDEDLQLLRRDKNLLILEVVRLRQEQQATQRQLQEMEKRLHAAEHRQQQMLAFLAKSMQNNNNFLSHIVQRNEQDKTVTAISKKRQILIQEGVAEKLSSSSDSEIIELGKSLKSLNPYSHIFSEKFEAHLDEMEPVARQQVQMDRASPNVHSNTQMTHTFPPQSRNALPVKNPVLPYPTIPHVQRPKLILQRSETVENVVPAVLENLDADEGISGDIGRLSDEEDDDFWNRMLAYEVQNSGEGGSGN
eukprot:c23329_g1_i1 orf=400-1368(-)